MIISRIKNNIIKILKKYFAIARINFINKLAYSIDLTSEIIFLLFIFTILFFLHSKTVLKISSAQVEVLSLAQIMWIVFFANIFAVERDKGIIYKLNEEIVSGQIAYQLNRPYSYIGFHFAQYIGTKLTSIIFGGLICGVFLYYLVGVPKFSLINFTVGILMLFIGLIINFLMQFCIGLSTFWIGNNDPLRWIYMQVLIIAGGAAVPLALFPAVIKKIILLLPFSNVVYGAARIIVGCDFADLFFYFKVQIFWLIIMLFLARIIFGAGVKNVVISGG